MANGHGGKRPGAGRRTTAEILGLAELIDEAWPEGEQKKVIAKLAKDCNHSDFHIRQESRKLLLSYKFGKPTERHEHTGKDGGPIERRVVFKRAKDVSTDSDN